MKSKSTSLFLLLLLAPACEEVDLPEHSEGTVHRAAKAPPLMGGTMLVTRDGAHAVISDPPRDVIHIVDLYAWEETATINLADGALPFRAVEDNEGRVHVTLRGTGELLTLNPTEGAITKRTDVCPNPRGVAFNDATRSLHVACAGGLLASISATGSVDRSFIAPDLRDVFVSDDRLFVTRFRAAEILEVEPDGSWEVAAQPISLVSRFSGDGREPSTAWRTLPRPDGGWVMLHQAASTRTVPGFEEPDEGFGDGGGYAGSDPCEAIVNPTLSATAADGRVRSAGLFGNVALAIDAAISPDGERVAIATPTQQDAGHGQISVFQVLVDHLPDDPEVSCEEPAPLPIEADIVAVAYQPDGSLLAQSRNAPTLYRVRAGNRDVLKLSGPDATDTGFGLFHNDAGAGIACASCHPEGGEDGRTWVFTDIGPRRTQALNVGLEGTAPFHWEGDMDDIHMIARQVRQGAMGGDQQPDDHVDALRDWMFSLRPPNGKRSSSDAKAQEGEQLFASLGCASCHAGPSFTSPQSADLGHGPLQTPALRGVALRPPYMHDGRATTLEDAVIDMAASTSQTVDDAQVDSLVAYLETL